MNASITVASADFIKMRLNVTGTAIANGYFVNVYSIDDRADLRAPANRKRTFAVLSRRASSVNFEIAVARAKATIAGRMRFEWLGDVIMRKDELTRSVREFETKHNRSNL